MDDFKAPFDIPQDLLLIQDLVADYRPPRPSATSVVAKLQSTDPDYDIDSSSDEDGDGNDSENEVMNLVLEADRHPPSSMRCVSSDLTKFIMLRLSMETIQAIIFLHTFRELF
jgi:hypothetical protein